MKTRKAEVNAERNKITGDHFLFYAMASGLAGAVISGIFDLRYLNSLIPLALFLMLYPMMLDFEPAKAARLVRKPGLTLCALLINFIAAPLLVFGLSLAFAPKAHPLLMAGMIVFGLIPCGGMVPAYTGALGGNVTLSVVISALSLVLSAGIAPLWMRLFMGRWFPFPYIETAGYLLGVVGFPFILAGLTRSTVAKRYGAETLNGLRTRLLGCVRWGFMGLMFIIFSQNGKLLLENPGLILEMLFPAAIFLSVLLLLSATVAKAAGWSNEDAAALTMSVSVKNTAVSIAFAASSLGAEAAMAIGIIGPLVQAPMLLLYLAVKR